MLFLNHTDLRNAEMNYTQFGTTTLADAKVDK